jgi:hypothetical protein
MSEMSDVGRTILLNGQDFVRPSDIFPKPADCGCIQAQFDPFKLSDKASDIWGLSDGIRVWHPGGCPRCPETHRFNVGHLIPSRRKKIRPQAVICPVCGDELAELHSGWIYYIRAISGEIKIGYATDLVARIGSLQTGNPYALHVLAIEPGNRVLEGLRHEDFGHHRGRGEWFYPAQELIHHAQSKIYIDLPFFEMADALKEFSHA